MNWIGFAILSAVSAAGVAVLGKIGIQGLDTTLATTVRALVMAFFLIIVSLALGKFGLLGTLTARPLTFIILSGVAGALSWLFYFAALKFGLASRVATVDRLSVVFVVLLAAAFLGETLTVKSIIGVTLLTIGAIVLVW